jgi:hypothetical protein
MCHSEYVKCVRLEKPAASPDTGNMGSRGLEMPARHRKHPGHGPQGAEERLGSGHISFGEPEGAKVRQMSKRLV